ncbi:MAG: hypothetical protein AAFP02_24020 [Bacteroidota bacterium]
MRQLFTLLVVAAALLYTGCTDNTGELGPITNIGRENGWIISSASSTLLTEATTRIANLTDQEISDAGETRENLMATYAAEADTQAEVNDCDRDDVLFFLENGAMRIIQGDMACPELGDPTVLSPFNDNFYVTDLEGTFMVVRTEDGTLVDEYTIVTITANQFVVTAARELRLDNLVGAFNFTTTYEMIPN